MKNTLKLISLGILSLFLLVGCGKPSDDGQVVKLGVVGDDQRLWEKAAELAKKDGITIKLVHFSDYNTPNDALVNGDVDLNAFQHKAFLDEYNHSKGTHLVPIGRTFISPIGAYSNTLKDLKDVPENGKVSIPNDTTNCGRALFLLEAAGLIQLKDNVGVSPTLSDIVANPKNIQINEMDAAQVARTLPDVDAAVINTNLAIDAGLSPKDDAIFMEPLNEHSAPYINYVVAREEDKDNALYQKVAAYYRTPEVKALNDKLYEETQKMAWELTDIPDAGDTATK
ncbi:putative D-methionine-binding lipoprotein MetQ [Aedoeadaptatus coxii]|uniref:MetQ/NlpA family ABC transporter substrate-binding protein n=1 Tax=Aedoeadaptatus coxii TaxID=755172 RepID=UPI001766169E|nr:MetQ/NlpA family ABC transporter substrate-binding protein [Peptoniphilus coxii]CAC9926167.1 putative D-methionine-binding lipoprotein MetQ [Peptoniphilus coxii]